MARTLAEFSKADWEADGDRYTLHLRLRRRWGLFKQAHYITPSVRLREGEVSVHIRCGLMIGPGESLHLGASRPFDGDVLSP